MFIATLLHCVCLCVSAVTHNRSIVEKRLFCFHCKASMLHQAFVQLFLFGYVSFMVFISECFFFVFCVLLVCLPASGSLCVRSRAFLYFHVFLFLKSVWVSECACTRLCVALPRQTSSCHSDQKAIIGVLLLWGEPSTLPLFLLSESEREANAERKRENRVAERVKKYMKKDWEERDSGEEYRREKTMSEREREWESEENKDLEEENVRLTLLDRFESSPEPQPLCPAALLWRTLTDRSLDLQQLHTSTQTHTHTHTHTQIQTYSLLWMLPACWPCNKIVRIPLSVGFSDHFSFLLAS